MKVGGQRNFSHGRSLGYAIRNILIDRFGDERYGTRFSHRERLSPFAKFLNVNRVNDLRQVSVDTVLDYAAELKSAVEGGYLAKSTAVNRLSSVNVLMQAARGDKRCAVSPAATIGRRSRVRMVPPQGLDATIVWSAAETARNVGQHDLAVAIVVCRFVGTRIREAALLDIRKTARSAARTGLVTIVNGSKCARAKTIPREISVSEKISDWLSSAAPNFPNRNLIPKDQTFNDWYQDVYRRFGPVAQECGLCTGFHDLRSAYACDRYRQLTGFDAPCIAGKRLASSEADKKARLAIAEELGHSRIDVVATYIGGRK